MIAISWIVSAVMIVGAAWWLFRHNQAVVLAVLCANYAAVIPMAGVAAIWISPDPSCSTFAGMIAALTSVAFVWLVVLVLLPFLKWFHIDRLKRAVVETQGYLIPLIIAGWWIVKIWLFDRYGLESLMVTQATADGQGTLSYLESAVAMLANGLLMGVIVLSLLRLVWRRISWQIVVIGAITLATAILIGDVSVGARRALGIYSTSLSDGTWI